MTQLILHLAKALCKNMLLWQLGHVVNLQCTVACHF